MMSEKIDWTQKLGDAFLAQQKDVMATAQAGTETVIRIELTNPEAVYVPAYKTHPNGFHPEILLPTVRALRTLSPPTMPSLSFFMTETKRRS